MKKKLERISRRYNITHSVKAGNVDIAYEWDGKVMDRIKVSK